MEIESSTSARLQKSSMRQDLGQGFFVHLQSSFRSRSTKAQKFSYKCLSTKYFDERIFIFFKKSFARTFISLFKPEKLINRCFWNVFLPFVIRSFIAVATFWRARQKLIEFVSRYLWKTRSTAEMSWVVKITFLVASSRTQFSMTWVNRGKWDSAR